MNRSEDGVDRIVEESTYVIKEATFGFWLHQILLRLSLYILLGLLDKRREI